jgi:hypothetical protein
VIDLQKNDHAIRQLNALRLLWLERRQGWDLDLAENRTLLRLLLRRLIRRLRNRRRRRRLPGGSSLRRGNTRQKRSS